MVRRAPAASRSVPASRGPASSWRAAGAVLLACLVVPADAGETPSRPAIQDTETLRQAKKEPRSQSVTITEMRRRNQSSASTRPRAAEELTLTEIREQRAADVSSEQRPTTILQARVKNQRGAQRYPTNPVETTRRALDLTARQSYTIEQQRLHHRAASQRDQRLLDAQNVGLNLETQQSQARTLWEQQRSRTPFKKSSFTRQNITQRRIQNRR